MFILYNVMQLASTLQRLLQLRSTPLASASKRFFDANTSTLLRLRQLCSARIHASGRKLKQVATALLRSTRNSLHERKFEVEASGDRF